MFTEFWKVMFFYALLSCAIMPFALYYINGSDGLEQGYIAGTILSIILWFTVGKKYAKI